MRPQSWQDINLNVKEFIFGLGIVFSVSGTWYKLYFEKDHDRAAFNSYKAEIKVEMDKREARIFYLEQRVRTLEDAETRRKAIEDAENRYYPLKRIK